MVREITVSWQVASSPGGTTVLYFDEAVATVDAQLASVGAMLAGCRDFLTATTEFTIANAGRTFDTATGALTGAWTDPTIRTDAGLASGTAVSNASMLLLRWATGAVVQGRFLQGRTFIPGMSAARLDQGQVNTATVVEATTAADGLATAGTGFVIWRRPQQGSGGVAIAVNSGSAWNELAVLRRRR